LFTGIVERTGTVIATESVAGGRRLRVDVGPVASESKHGDSICINGVCLTVTGINENVVAFDVIRETLDKTTLGRKATGDRVNIERSLRVGDRFDGHFVQGHVDGTATVGRIQASTSEHVVWLAPQAHVMPFMIPKGSVAIDGVSLTIAAVDGDRFSVALIPTTLDRTTFGAMKAGDTVNIESDIITRAIVHHLAGMQRAGGISLEALQKAGFA
jgi:riboflavin synthase